MFKKSETKLIVESWRSFIDNESRKDNRLDEVDLSSLSQAVNSGIEAIVAYGIPSALASIGLTAAIKLSYQKLINHFVKNPANKKAFLLFVQIIGKEINYDKFNTLVDSSGRPDTTQIDLWLDSGEKVVQKSMQAGKIKFNKNSIDNIKKELEAAREGNHGDFFNERIESLLSFWNAESAIKQFKDILENSDQDIIETLTKIYKEAEAHYEDYFKEAESQHRFWNNSPEVMAVLDVLFETMLLFYKKTYSSQSKNILKGFKELQERFGNELNIEKDKTGEVIVKINKDTGINCVLLLADLIVKHDAGPKYQSIDSIAKVVPDDYQERNYMIDKYHIERSITSDKVKKLKTLKKFLLFIKRLLSSAPGYTAYEFLKDFVQEFASDEILSDLSKRIREKINDTKNEEPKDFEKKELVKFIVSILLE